ncbi:hypothetical protein SAMN05216175_10628 [Neptunomonas qingdaonensis]|uniref:Calcineurin-like phosphoesterase domain-containing protein n=1 Tax=Neptunomonas qingdaonensis TaxID=1045558 RepID=A0A1I2RDM0_9GAMM|nr:hypothetical protein SAMN05216175_10628 [Neptunomonas qingdaonensis]
MIWDDYLWPVHQYKRALTKTAKPIKGIDAVVHGHVNCDFVERGINQVWIDTILGSGKLTVLSTDQLFSP